MAHPLRRKRKMCLKFSLQRYRSVLTVGLACVSLTFSQPAHLSLARSPQLGQTAKEVWCPDNGDGTYRNPIIYADYSDPDVIRVGRDFYMTSSSFSHFPGLPILHSNDLVNWRIIGHAVVRYPFESFNRPQHGNGIWAPSIRFHKGEYYIYFGDPDNGIFMTKAKNPAGPWDSLVLVRKAKGWIDPCPLWDDDGNAYLIHAWANSRVGIKSILTINRMNAEGTRILDEGRMVFDGRKSQPTIEGPKFYKRHGYYYVFAPAGGVKTGWQTVLRSNKVYGPYDVKKVLEQGPTVVNGPHQGAWIETESGESWFVHFQDQNAYGRVVHLEPMHWNNDWPSMGEDLDGNDIGEPVTRFRKPNVGRAYPAEGPQTSDEFNGHPLGLQWQWESNPAEMWYSLDARKGYMRLFAQAPNIGVKSLWEAGNILGGKFPGPEFLVTTRMEFDSLSTGGRAGLVVLGTDYSFIGVKRENSSCKIVQVRCENADKSAPEVEAEGPTILAKEIVLRVSIASGGRGTFSYSLDGKEFQMLGLEFVAKPGKWVGAKVGIFAEATETLKNGFVDFDWIRFDPRPQ